MVLTRLPLTMTGRARGRGLRLGRAQQGAATEEDAAGGGERLRPHRYGLSRKKRARSGAARQRYHKGTHAYDHSGSRLPLTLVMTYTTPRLGACALKVGS